MSINIGILVIILSSSVPALMPIGIFWPVSLAAIMSIALGVTGKFTTLKFSIGAILGSIIWVLVNFNSWAQLGVMLAAFQIVPTFIAILGFAVGYVFSPVQTHNKQRQSDA